MRPLHMTLALPEHIAHVLIPSIPHFRRGIPLSIQYTLALLRGFSRIDILGLWCPCFSMLCQSEISRYVDAQIRNCRPRFMHRSEPLLLNSRYSLFDIIIIEPR